MSESKKVALITGANKGIGLETARQLGKLGISVILGSRDAAKGDAAAAKLRAEGIDAQSIKLDVTEAKDRDAAVKFIQDHFGKLDILVNNAGIAEEGGWGKNTTSSTSAATLQKNFRDQFIRSGRVDSGAASFDSKKSRRTHRKSLQHSGFKHFA